MPNRKVVVVLSLTILVVISISISSFVTMWKFSSITDEPDKIDKNKKQYDTIRSINIFTLIASILIIALVMYIWSIFVDISEKVVNHLAAAGYIKRHHDTGKIIFSH